MYFGVDYYPEQWPYDIMEDDMDNMLDLGVNLVRIGEFAWHIMEPEEGKYDFSYFDSVLEKLKKRNIKVIFGTPTAAPPAWLVNKYPDILSKDENIMVRSFGGRRQYCFNSKIYWEYTKKIVKELVGHYSKEESIIAWQIDNEFGHEGSDKCYCEKCHKAFQSYLKRKYTDIARLNETYGTVFWSQTYNNFDEIPLPLKTITHHNPSLMLDYARFMSNSINEYSSFQANLIKTLAGSHQVVTTNLAGGVFDKYFDHEKIMKSMDIAAYDNYPVWGGLREPIKPHAIALNLDFVRGLKEKNFWIVEELMGAQGHTIIGYLPRPGQAKMWSYQAIAHGCEAMLYFRWRSAVFGTEEFCFGILDHDNRKGRKYEEVKSFFKELMPFEDILKSQIISDIAIVYDYDNIWSWKIQPQSTAFDYNNEIQRMYEPFYRLNAHIDVIPSDRDFENYKILVLPVMLISDKLLLEKVDNFVKNGGTLVLSFRAGIKDRNNNIHFGSTIPCGYKEMSGIEVEEVESLQVGQHVPIRGRGRFEGEHCDCEVWRDIIKCNTAENLFIYDDYFYREKSAITVNNWGKGQVYYVGCGAPLSVLQKLAQDMLDKHNIKYMNSPEGVEAYARELNKEKYLFLMNHTSETKEFYQYSLAPYESIIIKAGD